MNVHDTHLAELCRRAGFILEDERTAVALAIAASNGIPGYEHACWPGPTAHYVGLWGVDLIEHPDVADVDWHNITEAARAAYALTVDHDGFTWCPTYRNGAYVGHLERARTAASLSPSRPTHTAPVSLPANRRIVAGAAHQYRAVLDYAANRNRQGARR